MDVELLVVLGCPHEQAAAALLRTTLDGMGPADIEVRTTVIAAPEQAEQRGFVGSPTILINGVDPFAQAGSPPALACRVYRGPAGPTGVPPSGELSRALMNAQLVDSRPK
jgi:hypothetical protein